jgi:UDP-3-O-[3-hydroxymyristoyl] glucosamine N-acyltransferase
MPVTSFFKAEKPLSISDLYALANVELSDLTLLNATASFGAVASLSSAQRGDITFASSPKHRDRLAALNGVAVFVSNDLASSVPVNCFALIAPNPALAFNRVARTLYPESIRAPLFSGCKLHESGARVHPTAKIEDGVELAYGVVIGEGAEIGSGTRIAPNTIIGAGCAVGRNCDIGPSVTILCAYLGDKVMIGPGTRIGHDGFGFNPGPNGLEKVPQLGRVIIQNNVEIGANGCVDRGALEDTVIGEGTKIDNMVQIAHNVRIGRNCAIAANSGISGSATIGNNVMIGGLVGISNQVTIGDGAQIAATSGVMNDVPAGERHGGTPAIALKQYFRQIATLRALASRDSK